jgi:hypothetical protein
MAAERDNAQLRDQVQSVIKQISTLQKDNALARSPGRITVILGPQGKDAKSKDAAWAAVAWGELPDGKSFLRANAYGLLKKPEGGKTWHFWFTPAKGDPIDLGALDPDPDGNASVMVTELPPVDQGKAVVLTADEPGAKQPGDVLANAELPKLTPIRTVAQEPSETPQAKSGTTSQQMHQEGARPSGK